MCLGKRGWCKRKAWNRHPLVLPTRDPGPGTEGGCSNSGVILLILRRAIHSAALGIAVDAEPAIYTALGTRLRHGGTVGHLKPIWGPPPTPTSICLQPAAAAQLLIMVQAALVYAPKWDYPGFLGGWVGMKTGWLRLKTAKRKMTEEVQKAGGETDNWEDKPISALPSSTAAFFTQIKFAVQKSC